MKYKFISIVSQVTERFKSVYQHGVGKDAVFTNESLGWYVHLRDSYESFYVGREKPDLLEGNLVSITIEKQETK
jgi:hypothetical protein